jgi:aryl-alcohol dehydrogenase-like predicted oxidoreductase
MDEVPLRRLGETELEVTSIGLGAMQLSGGKGMMRFFLAVVPPEIQNEIIRVALESGMNWIDTAEVYGSGASEQAVSEGLKAAGRVPGDVLITTKWFPLFKRAKGIKQSAEKSSANLAPYPIDLYLIHNPMSLSAIQTQMDVMVDLIDEGKIRAVGVSNFNKNQMIAAHEAIADRGFSLATNQVSWSLLDRRIESNGVLEAAKDIGVTITAYTPLGQGILTGKLHKNPALLESMSFFRRRSLKGKIKGTQTLVEAIEAIADEHEAVAAQVSLSWGINYHGDTIVAIPGATVPMQAEQNAGAMRINLTSEQMDTLATLSSVLS